MSDKCSSCDAPILWAITLRGKRQPLDARPDVMRGNMFLAAADGELGTRLAIHVTHLADEAREHAFKQGLRLYRSHFVSCPARERYRRVAA